MLLIFWLRLIPSLRDYFGRDTGNCLGVSHKNSTLTGNLVKSILNYFYILLWIIIGGYVQKPPLLYLISLRTVFHSEISLSRQFFTTFLLILCLSWLSDNKIIILYFTESRADNSMNTLRVFLLSLSFWFLYWL